MFLIKSTSTTEVFLVTIIVCCSSYNEVTISVYNAVFLSVICYLYFLPLVTCCVRLLQPVSHLCQNYTVSCEQLALISINYQSFITGNCLASLCEGKLMCCLYVTCIAYTDCLT